VYFSSAAMLNNYFSSKVDTIDPLLERERWNRIPDTDNQCLVR
jgi:hypothetical protein